MNSVFEMDVDVGFGGSEKSLPDWRLSDRKELDPDDDEMEQTDADVISILGFDPKEQETNNE